MTKKTAESNWTHIDQLKDFDPNILENDYQEKLSRKLPRNDCCEQFPQKPIASIDSMSFDFKSSKIEVEFTASHPCGVSRSILEIVYKRPLHVQPPADPPWTWEPVLTNGTPEAWTNSPDPDATIKDVSDTLTFDSTPFFISPPFARVGNAVRLRVYSKCPVPNFFKEDISKIVWF